MKGILYLFFTLIVIAFTTCKKNEQPKEDLKATTYYPFDFPYIPTSDAKWKMHYQGYYGGDSSFYYPDSTIHLYIELYATGETAVFNVNTYNKYIGTRHAFRPGLDKGIENFEVFVRYDSTLKQIRILTATKTHDFEILEYNTDQFVGKEPCMRTWSFFGAKLEYGDSIEIAGMKVPALYMSYKGKKYFYQSIGIGGINAISSCFVGPFHSFDGFIRSLDFIHKSDSIHFDYPYLSIY